jgi:hypothetical protein
MSVTRTNYYDPGPIPDFLDRRLTRERFEAGGVQVSDKPRPAAPAPKVENDLDHIGARFKAAVEGAEFHTRNALRLFLDAGDELIAAKDRLPKGELGRWANNICPRVKEREAQVYMQLARRRNDIERALKANPDLSLRLARRLIMKRKENESDEGDRSESNSDAPLKPKIPDWVKAYDQSSDEDKAAGSDVFDFKDFFAHLTATKRAELEDLVLGNAAAHAFTKKQQNAIKNAQKARPYLELKANPTNN